MAARSMARMDAGHTWQQQVAELAVAMAQHKPWSGSEVREAVVSRK